MLVQQRQHQAPPVPVTPWATVAHTARVIAYEADNTHDRQHIAKYGRRLMVALATAGVVIRPIRFDPVAQGARAGLTERETQVLVGMSQGKSNAEIGRDLFLSEDTIKTHAKHLYAKLGAHDRAHAVAQGFKVGLLT